MNGSLTANLNLTPWPFGIENGEYYSTASELIDEMLILEARVLMQKSDIAVSEIAFEIGFDDVSYFGRFFKKHTGFAPTKYRKMIELSE
jgi:AraC-like DNA-binding protein